MEANGQTLYNDDLLNILPDGVIILDINREVIQLNQQALTELHVHSSVNALMPLPTNKIFKLLNKKEDILSTILEEIRQGKKVYSLPEHTFMQEQVDYTQFPIRGEFATMENEKGEKNILFFFRNITVELTQEYILNTALQRTRIYPWYYDISRSEFTLDDRYFEHLIRTIGKLWLTPLLYNLVVIQLLTKQFHSVCAGGMVLGNGLKGSQLILQTYPVIPIG